MSQPTAADLLRDLNQLDEHSRIEAKTGSELGKSALQTVCAFANEPRLGGGYLVFGVADTGDLSGRRYAAAGVPDPDKLQADLASQCASMFNRPLRPEMWTEAVDGKVLVGAHIPESPAGHKPVYFQAQGLPRGAFRRIGSADQRCTEDDLLVFFSDRQQRTFDQIPLPDVGMDELDPDAVADYRRERARAHPSAEELAWSDEDLLLGIGCALRSEGRVVPTVAGVLLFGRRVLLRRIFPMTRLDYIRVPGREWIEDPERRFETLDMRDPIVRLIRRAEAAILDDLPKRFNLPPGQLQRSDLPRIPDRVVREAVVNALMQLPHAGAHADHPLRQPDRDPEPRTLAQGGGSAGRAGLRDAQPAHRGHAPRNRLRRNQGERNPRDAPAAQRDESRAAYLRIRRGRDEFVATFFLHNLLDDEDLAWLAHFADLDLSSDETKALVHVREAGQITNAVYRDLNGVDTLEASSHLRRLRDLKLLQQHDRGAATFYTPTERCRNPAGGSGDESGSLAEQSGDLAEQSGNLAEQSGNLAEQSDDLEEKSDKLVRQNGRSIRKSGELQVESGELPMQSGVPALPSDLAQAVAQLNLWTPQPELRRLIQRLCAWRPLSAHELSVILQRSKTYLRTSYIGPMVQAGELAYTNPEKPNAPGQKYQSGRALRDE